MGLLSGKHIEKEINETRCRVVEDKISKERSDFLKKLLEHNGYEVLIGENEPKTEEETITYVVGVTDIIFNPVIAVYQRLLKTFDDRKVTPDYWNQKTENLEPNYWDRSKKDFE